MYAAAKEGLMWKNLTQRAGPLLCMSIGFLLLLYPWISNGWRESQAAGVIAGYAADRETMDMAAVRQQALRYNAALAQAKVMLSDPFRTENGGTLQSAEYDTVKQMIAGKSLGYIEIPAIRLRLPVYMGTETAVLEKGVGQLEGTSLPVGGESTHAVLNGHTGLHTARLFTDLEMVTTGDRFYLDILGSRMAYRVDAIQTVLPEETDILQIQKGQDRVTLVTCTPYGVNDHRLLVQGVRIQEETEGSAMEKQGKQVPSRWMRTYARAVCGGLWAMAVCRLYMWIRRRKR